MSNCILLGVEEGGGDGEVEGGGMDGVVGVGGNGGAGGVEGARRMGDDGGGGGLDGAVGWELMEEAMELKERVAWEVMEVVVGSIEQLWLTGRWLLQVCAAVILLVSTSNVEDHHLLQVLLVSRNVCFAF